MPRALWICLGILCGIALLATAFITWQHLYHWGTAKRLVHVGLIVLFGGAGGQCFKRALATK